MSVMNVKDCYFFHKLSFESFKLLNMINQDKFKIQLALSSILVILYVATHIQAFKDSHKNVCTYYI